MQPKKDGFQRQNLDLFSPGLRNRYHESISETVSAAGSFHSNPTKSS